jgi:hypothetical protein
VKRAAVRSCFEGLMSLATREYTQSWKARVQALASLSTSTRELAHSGDGELNDACETFTNAPENKK